jgi:hypothetical protein
VDAKQRPHDGEVGGRAHVGVPPHSSQGSGAYGGGGGENSTGGGANGGPGIIKISYVPNRPVLNVMFCG